MSNTRLRSFIAVILALLNTFSAWAHDDHPTAKDANSAATDAKEAAAPKLLTAPELFEVVNPDAMKMDKLLDFEKRDIRIILRNISDRALQVEGTRVTCDCLSFPEKTAPGTIKPGEELRIDVRIDGGQMKTKPFTRTILLDVTGHDAIALYLTGEVISMVSYAPSQVMHLGSFAGVSIPWQRTFTLKTAFQPDEHVILQTPPEDALFRYELKALEPQSYALVVSPKLPMPKGKFHHIIKVPVEGLDGYGPVLLALGGQATGWRLKLDQPDLLITTTGLNHEESVTKELRLLLDDSKPTPNRMRKLARTMAHKHDDHEQPEYAVAADELASDKLQEPETWEDIAKNVNAVLPAGVTMSASGSPEAVLVSLTFPPQFFSRTRRLLIPFTAYGNNCGRLILQTAP